MQDNKPKRMTVRECCEDAAGWLAYHWMTAAESILSDGREPGKLSQIRYEWAIDWVPEYVYASNERFGLKKNWNKIHALAIESAKRTLLGIGKERYPRVYARFVSQSTKP